MTIISSRLVPSGALFVMAVWSAGCSSASDPASTPDWHVEGRYEAQAIGKGTRFASITFSPDGTFSLVRANCATECTNAGRYRLVGGDTLALDYESGQSEAIPVLPELNVAAAKPANVPKVDLSSDIGVLCGPSDETTPAQFNLSPDKQAKKAAVDDWTAAVTPEGLVTCQ